MSFALFHEMIRCNKIFVSSFIKFIKDFQCTLHFYCNRIHSILLLLDNNTSLQNYTVGFRLCDFNNREELVKYYTYADNAYYLDGWHRALPQFDITSISVRIYRNEYNHSLIFGLRELNSIEINNYCSNKTIHTPEIINEESYFTSDYKLRIYASGCYHLDKNNNWQTDGMLVS